MELLIESKNDLEELKQEQEDFQPDTWKLEAVAVRDPVVVNALGPLPKSLCRNSC